MQQRLQPRSARHQALADRGVRDLFLQQREAPGGGAQRLVQPAVQHRQLEQLRRRLDLPAAGKRLELPGQLGVVGWQFLQKFFKSDFYGLGCWHHVGQIVALSPIYAF